MRAARTMSPPCSRATGDGEAEADAAGLGVARAFDAIERLDEDRRTLAARNAGPAILDGEDDVSGLRSQCHLGAAAIFHGVVDEVGDRPAQCRRAAGDCDETVADRKPTPIPRLAWLVEAPFRRRPRIRSRSLASSERSPPFSARGSLAVMAHDPPHDRARARAGAASTTTAAVPHVSLARTSIRPSSPARKTCAGGPRSSPPALLRRQGSPAAVPWPHLTVVVLTAHCFKHAVEGERQLSGH